MAPVVFLFLSCVAGFVIGGIPFGYLVGHFILKDDIRSHGSGNIGATNVGRVLGWHWGGLVLVLDALKGLIPTLGAAYLATMEISSEWHNHAAVAAGMSAVLGHMYPVYLRLRGGKGVATALGVVMVLTPGATGIALVTFLVVLAGSRQVAVASMLAAVTFGAAYLLLVGDAAWIMSAASLTTFAICVPLLIVWRHRSNIQRLRAGTEPAVTEKVHSAASDRESSACREGAGADDA